MRAIERVAQLLAEINFVLFTGGANTRRVLRNTTRIAEALNYHCDIFYSYSAIIITVYDNATKEKETIVKSIPHHGVNFNAISDISILSWRVFEKKLPIEVIEREVAYIKQKSHYNMYLMWFFVSLAGGSLAYIFGGDNHNSYLEMGISFLATLTGLAGRRLLQLRKFNVFICWAWAAFVSVSVVNAFRLMGVEEYKNALAACVLWLIPGVPLINGFIDMLTGYMVSGMAKLSYALMLVFMISIGFYLSLFVFGYELL